jgi:hypothetical protein
VLSAVGSAPILYAQNLRNDYFVHEFWAELEPMAGGVLSTSGPNRVGTSGFDSAPAGISQPGTAGNAGTRTGNPGGLQPSSTTAQPVSPPPNDQPITEILKEAQYVYSGMIYGFTFAYVPGDTTRGIAESFELKPVAEIKWGDPRLKILASRVDKSRLVVRVMYSLVPYQETWTQGWDSNVFPTATGRGTSRYFLSHRQKMASYKNAIKEAIRGYLRRRIYNKPREVVGQVVLRGSPYTIINAGRYVTTVTVKLRIGKVQPYTVF